MMRGRSLEGQRAQMARLASRPSISGIWTSMSITSYVAWSSRSSAWRPSPTVSAAYPSLSSSRSATFWFIALSSARRIRSGTRVSTERITSGAVLVDASRCSPTVSSKRSRKCESRSGFDNAAVKPASACADASAWPAEDRSISAGARAPRTLQISRASAIPSIPGIW
jgi:hypothetical protein